MTTNGHAASELDETILVKAELIPEATLADGNNAISASAVSQSSANSNRSVQLSINGDKSRASRLPATSSSASQLQQQNEAAARQFDEAARRQQGFIRALMLKSAVEGRSAQSPASAPRLRVPSSAGFLALPTVASVPFLPAHFYHVPSERREEAANGDAGRANVAEMASAEDEEDEGNTTTPRQRCQRCLNHNVIRPRKNHTCIYKNPAHIRGCYDCSLIDARREYNRKIVSMVEKEVDVDGESLLKEPSKKERVPICGTCRMHNVRNLLKNHKRVCPFKNCDCDRCILVKGRRRIMAKQVKMRRQQNQRLNNSNIGGEQASSSSAETRRSPFAGSASLLPPVSVSLPQEGCSLSLSPTGSSCSSSASSIGPQSVDGGILSPNSSLASPVPAAFFPRYSLATVPYEDMQSATSQFQALPVERMETQQTSQSESEAANHGSLHYTTACLAASASNSTSLAALAEPFLASQRSNPLASQSATVQTMPALISPTQNYAINATDSADSETISASLGLAAFSGLDGKEIKQEPADNGDEFSSAISQNSQLATSATADNSHDSVASARRKTADASTNTDETSTTHAPVREKIILVERYVLIDQSMLSQHGQLPSQHHQQQQPPVLSLTSSLSSQMPAASLGAATTTSSVYSAAPASFFAQNSNAAPSAVSSEQHLPGITLSDISCLPPSVAALLWSRSRPGPN